MQDSGADLRVSRKFIVESCGGLGGYLIGQTLCLSGYHNADLAWWTWRVGIGLFVVPYVTPIVATLLSAASQGIGKTVEPIFERIQTFRITLQDVLMLMAIAAGIVLVVKIYRLPELSPAPLVQAPAQNQRGVTAEQAQNLRAALDHVPSGKMYNVWFAVVDGCPECRIYQGALSSAWPERSHGWVVGAHPSAQLFPMHGLVFAWNTDQCPPAESKLIEDGLNAAHIPYERGNQTASFGTSVEVPDGNCFFLVGLP